MKVDVTKIYPFYPYLIKFKGKFYRKTRSRDYKIGDIAYAEKSCNWYTEGEFYEIIMCYPPNGFVGIIGSDNEPLGSLHVSPYDLVFYKPLRKTKK